jgi:hypothetical protein
MQKQKGGNITLSERLGQLGDEEKVVFKQITINLYYTCPV